jgi:hypothetical protein
MDTYLRVCTLAEGHDGDHLPYHLAPDKDEFGNKQIAHPRCLWVEPVAESDSDRYRVVFELIDPRFPQAGWHEVTKEHFSLAQAEDQYEGLLQLEREGEDVRNARLERAVVAWEPAAKLRGDES